MANRKRGNCEGSIYKTADGRWRAAVDYGYQNGKRKRKLLSGRTRREVSAKLTRLLGARQQGLPVIDERLTVGAWLGQWLADAETRLRPKTVRTYRDIIHQHLVPALGRHRLVGLTPEHVRALLRAKSAAGFSAKTCKHFRDVLRAALNAAIKDDLLVRNVAAKAGPPTGQQYEPLVFTLEQARRFLALAEGQRLEAAFVVALCCGVRQAELLGLGWADVSLEKASVMVRHQWQRVAGNLVLTEPKTRRSNRTVALPALAVRALRAHKLRQQQERLLAGSAWMETGLVFTTRRGTPLDARNLLRDYYRLIRPSGLPQLRWHDLRHSAASLLIAQGVSARLVMDVLGHASITTTMDTYSHVFAEARREAADSMDSILSPVAARMAANEAGAAIN